MSKPVPTYQISACENPDQVEVSREGFLKEEGKKPLCGWVSFGRKRFIQFGL